MNTAPSHDRFNGSDYVPSRDDVRLTGQLLRVFDVMRDGVWRTLDQISAATGDPQPSISAQLRHLRKSRFGGHDVEKAYIANGLYRYRLDVKNIQLVR
jgi:uncharacterized protein (DUF2132 family)